MITPSRCFTRKSFNKENSSTCFDKLEELLCSVGFQSIDLCKKNRVILPLTILQKAVFHHCILYHFFGNIITRITVLVNGFPYQCLPPGIHYCGERFVLRTVNAPRVRCGGEYSNVSKHNCLLKTRRKYRSVIQKQQEL